MRLKVLYFAAVRELVALDEESLEVPEGVRTVGDFARWIVTVHAVLEGRMSSVRVARNESFAEGDDPLDEGDVLALIPPVAGG